MPAFLAGVSAVSKPECLCVPLTGGLTVWQGGCWQHCGWSSRGQGGVAERPSLLLLPLRSAHQIQGGPVAAVGSWVCCAVGEDQCQPALSGQEEAKGTKGLSPLSTGTARAGPARQAEDSDSPCGL